MSYNEVDRMILDSIVQCSYCDGKNVSKCHGITTTLAGGGDAREAGFQGHRPAHEHDNNSKDATYICYDCDKKFFVIPLDGCWCGWRQSLDNAMSKIANWWNKHPNKEQAVIVPKSDKVEKDSPNLYLGKVIGDTDFSYKIDSMTYDDFEDINIRVLSLKNKHLGTYLNEGGIYRAIGHKPINGGEMRIWEVPGKVVNNH